MPGLHGSCSRLAEDSSVLCFNIQYYRKVSPVKTDSKVDFVRILAPVDLGTLLVSQRLFASLPAWTSNNGNISDTLQEEVGALRLTPLTQVFAHRRAARAGVEKIRVSRLNDSQDAGVNRGFSDH